MTTREFPLNYYVNSEMFARTLFSLILANSLPGKKKKNLANKE